jgi:hypothetical protein
MFLSLFSFTHLFCLIACTGMTTAQLISPMQYTHSDAQSSTTPPSPAPTQRQVQPTQDTIAAVAAGATQAIVPIVLTNCDWCYGVYLSPLSVLMTVVQANVRVALFPLSPTNRSPRLGNLFPMLLQYILPSRVYGLRQRLWLELCGNSTPLQHHRLLQSNQRK